MLNLAGYSSSNAREVANVSDHHMMITFEADFNVSLVIYSYIQKITPKLIDARRVATLIAYTVSV